MSKPKQRGEVSLDDLFLLEAVGEKEYDRIMRVRQRKAKRASINKDDREAGQIKRNAT